MTIDPGTGLHLLPGGLPRETRAVIEVARDNQVVVRRSLYLTGAFSWQESSPDRRLDRWGKLLSGDGDMPEGPTVCGAGCFGEIDTSGFRVDALQSVASARQTVHRVFLIGSRPGEIVAWPMEASSPTWDPVWAVPLERRGVALFCGTTAREPQPEDLASSCAARKLWRKVLWHWRGRIQPPHHPALAALWTRYQEAARSV
jgi:hypothetical protein